MNREDLDSIIARKAISGEGMTRKKFNQELIKRYGEEMRKLLKEFWAKRYLTVNSYKEVTVTRKYADYRISVNQNAPPPEKCVKCTFSRCANPCPF